MIDTPVELNLKSARTGRGSTNVEAFQLPLFEGSASHSNTKLAHTRSDAQRQEHPAAPCLADKMSDRIEQEVGSNGTWINKGKGLLTLRREKVPAGGQGDALKPYIVFTMDSGRCGD